MSNTRKLALVAIAAIAAMSMSAPSAFAQTVEVLDEATGQHCPEVAAGANHAVSGGCAIHFSNVTGTTTALYSHVPGVGEVVVSQCAGEFDAHIDEDGLGFVTNRTLSGGSCGVAPCDEPAPSHANLEAPIGLFELGGGDEVLTYTYCTRPSGSSEGTDNANCTVFLDASQSGHVQELSATQQPCHENPTVELSTHWEAEPGADAQEIEFPSGSGHAMEVTDEQSGEHCPSVQAANHVVSGGCRFHIGTEGGSTAGLYAHVAGVGEVLISSCEHELEAYISEDGFGFVTDQQLTGASCGLAPCDEAAPSHANLEWPIGALRGGGGNEALFLTLCLRNAVSAEGGGFEYCSLALDLTQTGHDQELRGNENSCVESALEFSGHWVTSVVQNEVEVVHAH